MWVAPEFFFLFCFVSSSPTHPIFVLAFFFALFFVFVSLSVEREGGGRVFHPSFSRGCVLCKKRTPFLLFPSFLHPVEAHKHTHIMKMLHTWQESGEGKQ